MRTRGAWGAPMSFGVLDILNLLGSLGLFLVGMKIMSEALMELAGNRMRRVMARLTSNRFKGMLTGLFITGLIQSSSSTTLMVVSFVNAGLLELTEALGVIMGANIGTTLTAWLIAVLGFKVSMSDVALPLMILGFLFSVRSDEQMQRIGGFIVGFALLFIGLDFMKDAVPDLQSNPKVFAFIESATGMGVWSLLLFLLTGTFLTLILQSSSATMAITLVAVNQGWLPFDAACAIVLGENVGTTITANMAAFVAGTNARRAALSHMLFNIIGVIWVLILFEPFLTFVSFITSELMGDGTFDPTVGLAVFHTTFNVTNTIALIGFVTPMSVLVTRLLPDREQPVEETVQAIHLDEKHLQYPETAIHAALQEARHLYREPIYEVVMHGANLHRHDREGARSNRELVAGSRAIISMDFGRFAEEHVRPIFNALFDYGTKIHQRFKLDDEDEEKLRRIGNTARDALLIAGTIAQFNAELNKQMQHPSPAVQAACDEQRLGIVEFIDKLEALDLTEGKEALAPKLDALKVWAKKCERRWQLDVRRQSAAGEIPPDMAASLYASARSWRSICRDVLKVARNLSAVAEDHHVGDLDVEEIAA